MREAVMRDVLDDLAAQQAELAGLIADLDEAGWQRPSRCEGWTVADVVVHVAQTNELAIASARGPLLAAADELGWIGGDDRGDGDVSSVDDLAERAVVRERGTPGPAVGARWQRSADELVAALEACDPSARVQWVAGTLSARTLATTRLSETWIHTDDVADAFGVTPVPTDRLRHIARLAWRTLPYAFAREGRALAGPVAMRLRAPSGDRWDFVPDAPAVTTIEGDGFDWCLVAARRADPATTSLRGTGPDVDEVLRLARTYA